MADSENRRLDPSISSMFKDISNLKTPKPPKRIPKYDTVSPSPISLSKFYTASKLTPLSSAMRSKTARKLKAFELEQNKSSRKAQSQKEKSLKSLAKSLTVWLNFLFENPRSCGCDISKYSGELGSELKLNEKKDGDRGRVRVRNDEGEWRGPKRQRGEEERGRGKGVCDVKFLVLRGSLKEICSFDDLEERMRVYLSLGSCKEIFETMTVAAKGIDDGRLKMRLSCPIVSDVGMKENAVRILMCYNPIWLRIGLYIILGGDSLMPNGDVNNEQEIAFLKIVIEKQFFSHAGLAKFYSYNKLVEGLYRPGYYEKLGSVILKRFLLLVLVLDRVKSQSSLPLKYGIDGLDGGSPLLFSVKASIKSSSQMINDFLSSDVMHGEGNLLTHLLILGYKVTHQQIPITEYDFKVTDLFEDLQDGVRLCRAIQLLRHDYSILMKMVVPSDSRKKSLVNCDTALQYLTQASVPLCDDDGIAIIRDDIANGDKELLISLLWNMFVHLQVPLLVNTKILAEEIYKVRGVLEEYPSTSTLLDMLLRWIQATCACYDLKVEGFSSLVDGKATWCLLDYYFRKEHKCTTSFKALGDSNGEVSIVTASDYTDAVHNFILSQKLTSLLGNFPEVLQVSDLLEHNCACNDRSVVILLVFLSFQLLVKKNTDQINFHKLLGFDCQSSQRKQQNTERWSMHFDVVRDAKEFLHDDIGAQGKFKAIMTWWQDMAQQNKKCEKSHSRQCSFSKNGSSNAREYAATIIQAHFRRYMLRRRYLKVKNAVCILQCVTRAWLAEKGLKTSTTAKEEHVVNAGAYLMHLIDKKSFSNLRTCAVIIQRAIRAQLSQRYKVETMLSDELSPFDHERAAIEVQKMFRGGRARSMYMQQVSQLEKTAHPLRSNELLSDEVSHLDRVRCAITIQKVFRGWRVRSMYTQQLSQLEKTAHPLRANEVLSVELSHFEYVRAAITIQKMFRGGRARSIYVQHVSQLEKAAVLIQRTFRQFILSRTLRLQHSAAVKIQCSYRGWQSRKMFLEKKLAVLRIQSIFRCIRCQRQFQIYKQDTKSAIVIQKYLRGRIGRQAAIRQRDDVRIHVRAAITIQKIFRGGRARSMYMQQVFQLEKAAVPIQHTFRQFILSKKFWLQHSAAIKIQCSYRGWQSRKRFLDMKLAVLRIQSIFRCIKCQRQFQIYKQDTKSAIVIQKYLRGRIARQSATRQRYAELSMRMEAITVIHSAFICMKYRRTYLSCRQAAIQIQSLIRGAIARKRILGASTYCIAQKNRLPNAELKVFLRCVLRLQRWWKGILLIKMKTRSAMLIQSSVRGWLAKKSATREKMYIVLIQSHWRGYIARRNSKVQLVDLRQRLKKSAANVDDNRRLINRLVAAVSELLNMRSVSGILHTCETLDMATELSQKCCDELVNAGAIGTLLELIGSVSRSIPDQQILKHALSTLVNLARYPHLTEVLTETRGLVETILSVVTRNKEEGYFIATELMKKIFGKRKAFEVVCKFPAHVKRLHSLVEELSRKEAALQKRNARGTGSREQINRRLKEANELWGLIMRAKASS